MPRVLVLALLVVASVAWSQASALIVEIPSKRIVLLPSVPDDWTVCDGADGACVSVAALRQATAMREQPR